MSETKENNRDRGLDKNLQDDWLPDQQRRAGATSSQIAEYGGDLKRKDTLNSTQEKKNINSQKDQTNWKKKNV
ncbi:MAG: hypothetical protein H7336_07860 [Bacteriovorax sp.]|nr:hypothetical protein [Bacteriovorax sp.]